MANLTDGLDISIAPDAIDDMELLEDLSALQKGDFSSLSSCLVRLLGEDGKKALYEHLRRDGKVRVTDVSAALNELLINAGKKNS